LASTTPFHSPGQTTDRSVSIAIDRSSLPHHLPPRRRLFLLLVRIHQGFLAGLVAIQAFLSLKLWPAGPSGSQTKLGKREREAVVAASTATTSMTLALGQKKTSSSSHHHHIIAKQQELMEGLIDPAVAVAGLTVDGEHVGEELGLSRQMGARQSSLDGPGPNKHDPLLTFQQYCLLVRREGNPMDTAFRL